MKFKSFLKTMLDEETSSSDIATVTNKLDLSQRHLKHSQKGKKCKEHKKLNCVRCEENEEDRYN